MEVPVSINKTVKLWLSSKGRFLVVGTDARAGKKEWLHSPVYGDVLSGESDILAIQRLIKGGLGADSAMLLLSSVDWLDLSESALSEGDMSIYHICVDNLPLVKGVVNTDASEKYDKFSWRKVDRLSGKVMSELAQFFRRDRVGA